MSKAKAILSMRAVFPRGEAWLIKSALCLAALTSSGCSVYMASSSPTQPELSAVRVGASRAEVDKELGKPINFLRQHYGDVATYQYFGPDDVSYGRAAAYTVLDILTLGVAELITTPIETLQNDKHTLVVTYNPAGRVLGVSRSLNKAPLEKPERLLGLEERKETLLAQK
jgi:hypothetical protein